MFLFGLPLFAAEPEMITAEEILAKAHEQDSYPTECASKVFATALDEYRDDIDEDLPEEEIRAWAQTVMFDDEVLKEVLNCPEIKSAKRTKTIFFDPIVLTFDNGRTITINYTTQPKVLEQKLLLATKPSLPTNDPSPRLMDPNDPAIYINTDPAWYAIMVVQHDSLSKFVGPDKNNTLSIQWINDNIDSIYPQGFTCTSKSAIADDHDTINEVVRKVVDLEDDSNDYYVAGDINLEWIMYAEIVGEIALDIVTMGGAEGVLISLKGARATRLSFRLAKNAAKLQRFRHVAEYSKVIENIASLSSKIVKNTKNIKNAKRYEKVLKELEEAKRLGKDVSSYERKAQKILQRAKTVDPSITPDKLKNVEKLESETQKLSKKLPEMEENLQEMMERNAKLLVENKNKLKQVAKNTDSKKIKEYEKLQKEMDKIRDSKKYDIVSDKATDPKLQKRVDEIQNAMKQLENSDDFKEYARLSNEVNSLESVKDYAKTADTLKDLRKYHGKLSAIFSRPQTGNIVSRNLKRIGNAFRTLRASQTGAKTMTRAGRIARAGMSSRSAKIGDWLFDVTLKHGARLARFFRDTSFLYSAVVFLGDMYDQTSTTSQEFSNGIEFKPFCLLSADDLEGQDNVVNYGMWFMWIGNSTDSADDDAAYLQAMDFAEKFSYALNEHQEEYGANCNVDIYVVRPIIRLDESDPEDTKGDLFYLFMNDIPWTTAGQF